MFKRPFLVLATLIFLYPSELLAQTAQTHISDELDSVYMGYLRANAPKGVKVELLYDSAEVVPQANDSIYKARLAEIPSIIPLDFNAKTRSFIEVYVSRKRYAVPQMLALSEYYFPMIEEELDKAGLPIELKYMAIIESALQTGAVSRSGAVGMWQFMYNTAKIYKLEITTYVDERKDPVKATKAACKYMSNMYKVYGDWQLAIAAYNCGPGNVNKAIRRSGGKKNFWEIYSYLPRETRGYVPAFIAACYTFNYYNEHNLQPDEAIVTHITDTVMVNKNLHLEDAGKALGVSLKTLQALNPQYRHNIIPGRASKPYALVLPTESALSFTEFTDTIYKGYDIRVANRATEPKYTKSTPSYNLDGKAKVYYTVKSGDNLGYIADWYDTYVSRIKSWNGLRNNMIKPGQKLVIYVPTSKEAQYKSINSMSFAQKQGSANAPNVQNVSHTKSTSSSGKYIYYKVKYGDSVWEIVQRYPGNTVSGVTKLNNIGSKRGIMPGDVLKLNPKS